MYYIFRKLYLIFAGYSFFDAMSKSDPSSSTERLVAVSGEALVRRFEVDRDRAAEDYLGFVAKLLSVHALREVESTGAGP